MIAYSFCVMDMNVLTAEERPPDFTSSIRAPYETVLAYRTPNSSLKPTKMNAYRMRVKHDGRSFTAILVSIL